MAVTRKRAKRKPTPLLGSKAFGNDPNGLPTGAKAVGGNDAAFPVRGALLFGNDPAGNPTGSKAVGGGTKQEPLRGAKLFGNLPQGGPSGSKTFGSADKEAPVRGALLFGNHPAGLPTGALAFGNPSPDAGHRGSKAFGAPQYLPEHLSKDAIGYDFGGVILKADEGTMSGIRKDPLDGVRRRVLRVLERRLEVDVQRLRHGLDENAVKWGALRQKDCPLDGELAVALQQLYQKAPGERLGIGHVRDLLEASERMHSFVLHCSWDRSPVTLSVLWGGETVAFAETRHHKEHTYFEIKDVDGEPLGYADELVPRRGEQVARVRGVDGGEVASIELLRPGPAEAIVDGKGEDGKVLRLQAVARLGEDDLFTLEEEITTAEVFRAKLLLPGGNESIGRLEDRLVEGNIKVEVELDLGVPQVLAWGLAAIFADLTRRRRGGWPALPDDAEPELPSVRQALGPRRRKG